MHVHRIRLSVTQNVELRVTVQSILIFFNEFFIFVTELYQKNIRDWLPADMTSLYRQTFIFFIPAPRIDEKKTEAAHTFNQRLFHVSFYIIAVILSSYLILSTPLSVLKRYCHIYGI